MLPPFKNDSKSPRRTFWNYLEYAFLHVSCAGVVEPVEVVDNGDQTHTVSYVPTKEGPYSINVLYADEEIPRRYTSTSQ